MRLRDSVASRIGPLLAVVWMVVAAPAVSAAPTCTVSGTEPACGGRVVAEPISTLTFLQFAPEFPAVLEAIEAVAPDVIEVATLAEWNDDEAAVSYGGRDLWVVRVTDESVPDTDKRHVVASLSIHGNESIGREGAVRYLEDIARWHVDDPQRQLYSGDVTLPLDQVLRDTVLWLGFLNPDGWAAGDVTDPAGPAFARGNANNGGGPHTSLTDGADLNREFPTTGWTKRANTQLSEPEAIAWVEFVRSLPRLTTASDIHGELTSATDSFADMMWPAGQWDPTRQAQELQLAEHMTATIERKFEEYGVVIDDLFALFGSGSGLGTKPAQFATAYDIVGYDDSGFMGDWLASQGAVEIDVEGFLSHLVPNNAWIGLLEEGHAAAVRGIVESLWVEALITDDVTATLDLGRVAYVDDPARITSADGFGFELEPGEVPEPYDVSRLQYFTDLAAVAGGPIDALDAAVIAAMDPTDLAVYDTLVVADNPFPDGLADDPAARQGYLAALEGFVDGGGQLLLTDAAIVLLADLGLLDRADIQSAGAEAGHVDFGERDHPWEDGLVGLPAQTYYEVPLGYRSGDGEPEAPHHGVEPGAWEDAGGVTVGTSMGMVTLGELALGEGRVSIFGAILPTQTEANPHLYGLADYGVTVNGGIVLHEILSYRSGTGPATPSPSTPEGTDHGSDLPATGTGATGAAALALLLALSLRHRRIAVAGPGRLPRRAR